jgi:hypothetical protein
MPQGITGPKRIDLLTLGNRSINLWEYDEDTQREYIQTLAHMYKHAKVGDPQFIEICQGRAEPMAKAGQLFSTCGEFAMFLLDRAGYRGPILNRDLDEPDPNGTGWLRRKWKRGKNIYMLFTKARKEGVFVEYLLSRDKGKRPNRGDIIYVSNGTPKTEHVFYFDGINTGPFGEELWVTIDGGRGGIKTQHIGEGEKYFDQDSGKVYAWDSGTESRKGSGRRVIGWLNPILLEFTSPANLKNAA